jgi:hypothetical protein
MVVYLSSLSFGKIVLWCYLIWYLITVMFYFDPSPAIWLNSLGISVVIGIALMLSVDSSTSWHKNKWQIIRLFLMPLGVSSFSSLIKGQGYWLIVPPKPLEILVSIGGCVAFVAAVFCIKQIYPRELTTADV